MRIQITISDALFQEAEESAHSIGISRNELYALALKAYLRRYHTTEQYNRVHATEVSVVDPVLQQLQYKALSENDWE